MRRFRVWCGRRMLTQCWRIWISWNRTSPTCSRRPSSSPKVSQKNIFLPEEIAPPLEEHVAHHIRRPVSTSSAKRHGSSPIVLKSSGPVPAAKASASSTIAVRATAAQRAVQRHVERHVQARSRSPAVADVGRKVKAVQHQVAHAKHTLQERDRRKKLLEREEANKRHHEARGQQPDSPLLLELLRDLENPLGEVHWFDHSRQTVQDALNKASETLRLNIYAIRRYEKEMTPG
mmetsp:Transcript_12430/g.30190  ORF Transcript_12430/g.30190 Transcript_12430/m.30190 type:complete len:233 (+) Transcript_12430:2376-3074(+)